MSDGDAKLFTLGIEEEFQLIDPETRDLRSHVQYPPDDAHTLADQLKPELHQSVIEVGTNICPDIRAARREMVALRRDLSKLAARNGLTIAAAGTHPFAHWRGPPLTGKQPPPQGVAGPQHNARGNPALRPPAPPG